MSAAFRWQIVVPRLLLVVVVILAAQYSLGRIARWFVAGSLESAAHAPVELAHARVSLLNRQLVLGELRLLNMGSEAQKLVEFDSCCLDFATVPLLYKRAIVERGTVSGLRFGTACTAGAGKSRALSASMPQWFHQDASDQARRWLQNLDEQFERELLGQFESVRQTDELCARWPKQVGALDQRVRELKRRASEMQQSVRAAQINPLRHVTYLARLPDEVATLRAEFGKVNAELEELVQSLDTQRRSIVEARRQDDEILRQRLHLDPIDPSLLTAYLLQEQVKSPLNEVITCLRWMRQVVPADAESAQRSHRGEDVLFAGCQPTPSFLIRNLQLHGTTRIGGQPVELRGILRNYSNAPAIHPNPICLHMKTVGSLPLELHATIDRTAPTARDELLLDCRGVVLSELDLGGSDEFHLTLAPSIGELSVSVLVDGEKLSGDIQLVQKQVRFTPFFSGQLSDIPLAAALQDTLSGLDAVASRLTLGGTLSEPTCSLWSNLGPAVAEAMDRALRRSGDQHIRALAARARQHVDEQLASLERQAQEQKSNILAQISSSTGELQAAAGKQLPAPRISHEQLGRRLPAGSLFR
jgi:uncharacterized protein (TIGR03545 family)